MAGHPCMPPAPVFKAHSGEMSLRKGAYTAEAKEREMQHTADERDLQEVHPTHSRPPTPVPFWQPPQLPQPPLQVVLAGATPAPFSCLHPPSLPVSEACDGYENAARAVRGQVLSPGYLPPQVNSPFWACLP